jgi:putative tricarboxylic transport membrane protein
MIPLMVLGIPAIPATAILLSALLIHGVQPGPLMMSEHPQVFWGLIASLYLGNIILVVLNLPLVSIFVTLLRTPMGILAPMVLVVCLIGVYSVKASPLDLVVVAVSGVVGYLLRKFAYDVAPLLLAFVLADRLELSFRRALTISDGDYAIFVQGPAVKVFLAVLLVVGVLQAAAIWLGYRTRTS